MSTIKIGTASQTALSKLVERLAADSALSAEFKSALIEDLLSAEPSKLKKSRTVLAGGS